MVLTMFVVKKEGNELYSVLSREIEMGQLKALGSPLAQAILKSLAKKDSYPSELAKELNVNEQKVYYHIRNLEKAKIIKVVKKEVKQGALAKYYSIAEPSFFIRFKEFKHTQKINEIDIEEQRFLSPFIKEGQLDALIVVGSPEPHGPDKARSRDGYYGIDLALFLGTFLSYVPHLNVKLDTEIREEDLSSNNLILIGGPVVNKVTLRLNKQLPVFFDKKDKWCIVSSISKKRYYSDEGGIIAKIKNPLNKEKSVLVIAGKRLSGTKASITAFLKGFSNITKGNIYNPKFNAKIVEGVDMDSDGAIDSVEFKE